jgi:hypothetical protein
MSVPTIETSRVPVNVPAEEDLRAGRIRARRLGFRPVAPKKKAPPNPDAGRYPLRVLTAEIETARRKLGINVKTAAADAGVGRKVWYKKRDMDGSSFTLEDISLLAEAWDAPEDWPFRRCIDADWKAWRARRDATGAKGT